MTVRCLTSDELKEFIKFFLRENLELIVEVEPYSSSNNQTVGLKFKGDEKPFTAEIVFIPADD